MGCGSSSLKGDAPDGVNTPAQPTTASKVLSAATAAPVQKVRTNFSSVDYDKTANRNKSMAKDRAPDELDDASPIRGNSTAQGGKDMRGEMRGAHEHADEDKLVPYRSVGDEGQNEQLYPHEKMAGAPQAETSAAENSANGQEQEAQ